MDSSRFRHYSPGPVKVSLRRRHDGNYDGCGRSREGCLSGGAGESIRTRRGSAAPHAPTVRAVCRDAPHRDGRDHGVVRHLTLLGTPDAVTEYARTAAARAVRPALRATE